MKQRPYIVSETENKKGSIVQKGSRKIAEKFKQSVGKVRM